MRPLLRTLLPGLVALFGPARVARAEAAVDAGALASADNQGYAWQRYQAQWVHDDPAWGQRVSARWHHYSLRDGFAGVVPFDGAEPAVEVAAHLLAGFWWLGAAAGFQGRPDLAGATGALVVARAFPGDTGTLTPRLEAARESLAAIPLPLSLGLTSDRAQAALGWKAAGWTAELGARLDVWEAASAAGRVQNPMLERVDGNRIFTGYGYALTQGEGWLDVGLAGKIARADHNTLLATQVAPSWQYSWYPASAPPFAWEVAAVVRAHGHPIPSVELALQAQLPAVSRETRQWESVQESAWGTAPWEARLQASWLFLAATALQLDAGFFAKPWERWDAFGAGAYRMATAQVSLRQSL
jgi:hypothetical protein